MWQKHAAFASEAGQGRHSIIRKEWARRGVRSGQSGQFTPLRGVSGGCRAPPRAQADPGTPPFSPVSSRSWAIVSQTPPVPPSINFSDGWSIHRPLLILSKTIRSKPLHNDATTLYHLSYLKVALQSPLHSSRRS
jgi:hypothetical protein